MVFFHALQGILSLQIIVTVAYVLARKGWFSPETQILLPRLVTTVALPSYLFYTITHSFGRTISSICSTARSSRCSASC